MSQADFIHVQTFLSGVDYPTTKRRLVEHARENGADQQALKALEWLPDREYDGPNAVSKELGTS